MTLDEQWCRKMAEREDYGCVSAGGLLARAHDAKIRARMGHAITAIAVLLFLSCIALAYAGVNESVVAVCLGIATILATRRAIITANIYIIAFAIVCIATVLLALLIVIAIHSSGGW